MTLIFILLIKYKFYYLKNKGTLVNLTFCKRDTNYQGGYANVELDIN